MINEPFTPDWKIAPGATLEECLEHQNHTHQHAAETLGITSNDLDNLLSGVLQITLDLAEKLELLTGVPAGFWMRLEKQFRS